MSTSRFRMSLRSAPSLGMPRLLALVLWSCAGPLLAQQGDGTQVSARVSVVKPAKVEATPERMRSLHVPRGFQVAPFATGLQNVRVLVAGENGRVYASRRDQGDVILLQDADGDGQADGPARSVLRLPGAHGLALHGTQLYVATAKEIFVADMAADGVPGTPRMLVGDLPDGGQHPNRTLGFGPDGMLYVSVGSSCNACNETNPEHATLLRMSPDGKSRVIIASGLRNTIGFDWHPASGELWSMDHGIDFLGDDDQPEEVNLVVQGRQYGWPHVYADGRLYPQSTPPPGISKEEWKAWSAPMRLGYTAHAAPMQLVFYRGGSFPAQYDGDAFVTMRGSWNRQPPSGYEVVRLRFEDGQPQGFEPFLRGFLVDGGRAHFARPMGLAIAADGALLVGDDANGVIYRVSAEQPRQGASRMTPPAGPMQAQARAGIGVPLAQDRPETASTAAATSGKTLQVRSPAFAHDGPIPRRHSEYADGLSPALAWNPVEGARSYAIVMEDPDARPITPFVHWVAWNIPAALTTLPEGMTEQLRLTDPAGLTQGRNSRGSVGYYGPRPPAGDPPHHYRFLVLALDRELDLEPGATRDELLAAVRGHVLAKGVLGGTFQQQQEPPR
jgi:Raf kinase inhibitor-like YbhB/YbcL family protein